MKRLNVAIIGQGRSGKNIHGAFFKSDANQIFNVTAVVDEIPLRRERAKTEYNCDVYSDYKELFGRKDIDIVVNSSFSHMHYPITMELLKHKLNVLVEKPISKYTRECDEMIKAARDNGVMLAVFQQSRFSQYYKIIKKVIDSGVLGKIVQISIAFSGFSRRWDWQTCQRYYGGNILNTGPHPMDQALALLDTDEMPFVFSRLDSLNVGGDAEDYAKIILTLPSKPVIDVEISCCNAYSDYTYKIQGSCGSLKATITNI